ncbi:peptidase [Streptomyces sp. A1136]|uniref:peptidase n=1 Tax=Streptomyces sp. A1136 TaxID=2563102 RepID=UPI00109E6F94|nr:peptidase [Streptomyces sp. A1136]THA56434.1 peptidase [Streptomyces sp. A1136]
MRKRISLLAACGLVALGTATVPANAAEPVFPLIGPAALDLPLPVEGGSAREQRLSIGLDGPATPGASFTGLFRVDLSKVAGVATVREHTGGPSHQCVEKDGALECAYVGLPVDLELDVAAAKGAANGATGEITVTGKVPGATVTALTTKVSVGGPDLVMREMSLKKDLTPGETQPMPLVFANAGTQAAHGVVLELGTTRGMELVETYDNCRTRAAGDLTTVLCSVEGDFVPGAVYELAGDSPLHIEATRHAYDDTLVYGIHPAGDEPKATSWSSRATTGRKLTATPVKSAPAAPALRATDLNPGDNRREFVFHTRNTADFATSPVSLKGKKGDTLTTAFTFENKGPAWIRAARPADSAARTVVVVPEGAKVTRKPQECLAVDTDGTKRVEQLGAPRYECALGNRIGENEKVVYPFDLKVEKVVEDAKGSVTVGDWGASAPRPHAFDPNAANNTAAVVINAKGGTGTGPTPGPSTSGSPSPSPSVSASASASPTASASGAGTGTTAQGGNLASTGSTVGPLAIGAAALVAAGGALYVAVRRRGARA